GAMAQAGDSINGIYFVGSAGQLTSNLEDIPPGKDLDEATIYQTKGVEYGMTEDDIFKGFATQGFSVMMTMDSLADEIAAAGGEVNGATLAEAFANTQDTPAFGSTPLSCATAPAPYVAVCNSLVNVTQWDGDSLTVVSEGISGIDLVAGTELKPGPG
ncbi:MAG: hypothetical protein ACE367_00505, partial [Acidimicrobiales bacterium]